MTHDSGLLRFLLVLLFTSFSALAHGAIAVVNVGQDVSLNVTATGTVPFSYQWYKDGIALGGETDDTFEIDSAQLTDTGVYTVKVTNAAGSTLSDLGMVTVSAIPLAPVIGTQPADLSAPVGSAATFSVSAGGLPLPTYQWRKNGTAIPGATSASYTITSVGSVDTGAYSVAVSNLLGTVVSADAQLSISAVPGFTTQPIGKTVNSGTAITFTAAASGAPAPTFQWKKDGVAIAGATSTSYSIASATSTHIGTYTLVATNANGVATSQGAILAINAAPVIIAQPANQTVGEGSPVSLSVTATGTPTPTYQWKINGTAISGATAAVYSIGKVATTHAGAYSVVVTNAFGSVTSAVAELKVKTVPVFTTQPAGKTVVSGAAATLSAVVTGWPSPVYQWQKNGVNIAGATSATYTISAVSQASAATYTLVASNAAGSATSKSAALVVTNSSGNTIPAITTQPVGGTGGAGASYTLAVVATGTPAPTYQWRLNGTAISGATSASYAIAKLAAGNAGLYSVVVTNSAGSVTSANAELKVSTAPVIDPQPLSQSVTVGSSVTFTSGASGSPAPTYQWKKDGVNISGATAASYSLSNVASANAASYTLVATNSSGSTTSQAAVLKVTGLSSSLSVGADFNGDGWSDLLWQNVATGDCTISLMNGTVQIGTVSLGKAPAGWSIVGAADFNGDGKTDILWRKTDGSNSVWLMAGTILSSTYGIPSAATDWEVAGTGDFNQDGRADIIWRNMKTREQGIWLMNGTNYSRWVSFGIASANWFIRGAGDFNGDEYSDLIWYNSSTYEVQVQLMNGVNAMGVVKLGSAAAGWNVAGTGDFNDDGRSDILWQSGGRCDLWLTNGSVVSSKNTLTTVAAEQKLKNY